MFKSRKFAAFAFIVFFFTIVGHAARAQKTEDEFGFDDNRIFYAGVIGGINCTQVDGDHYAGFTKVGLNVGGIGYVRLRKHMALSWEILYSQKGSRGTDTRISGLDSVTIFKYGIVANYAEIPVMINFFDKRLSHIGAGFSYNQLVSSSESATYYPNYGVDLTKYPFNKTDIELLLGAHLHLWKGFFLNLRYQYSILPIRTNVPPYLSRDKQYNNMWTVRFMYLLM